MVTQPRMLLNDGNYIPQLGLGVWKIDNKKITDIIEIALDIGYRSIDTASIYNNEEGIGKALQNMSIPRENIFITTKLWNDDQSTALKAIETSLSKLRLDYVDLYLIHWPVPSKNLYIQAWKELVKIKEIGLAKSIGVSNFEPSHITRLIDEVGIVPVLNQIELHPMLQQNSLRLFNARHHILTESWSPLGQGKVSDIFSKEIIYGISKKYSKTPAQIIIRWHIDNGLIVIPKSETLSHINDNFNVFDFNLTKEDLDNISKLDVGKRLGSHPDSM